MWPSEFHAHCQNGWAKLANAIGATKSSLASAGAPGVQMLVAVPGNVNTFGDLLDLPQNDGRNIGVQNLAVLQSDEIAK